MTRTFAQLGRKRLGSIALGGDRNPGFVPPPPGQHGLPAISVQISFTDVFATPTWVDITKYVRRFSTTAGRQHELQQVGPSTAQIVLYNSATQSKDVAGRWSPWNTSSPYYKPISDFTLDTSHLDTDHLGINPLGLTPGHPVRITATWQSTSYPIYYGYTDAFTPSYASGQSDVTLTCSDMLKLLNLSTLDTRQYSKFPIANAAGYYPLSDSIGSATVANLTGGTAGTVLSGFLMTFGVAGPLLTETATAVTSVGSVGALPGILIPPAPSGPTWTVEGWINSTQCSISQNEIFTVGTFPSINLGTDTPTGYAWLSVGGVPITGAINICDGHWHYLVGTCDGATVRLYVDGVLVNSTASPVVMTLAAQYIAIGGEGQTATFAQIAVYTIALTPTQITSQYQIGTATWAVQDSGARVTAVLGVVGVPLALRSVGTGVSQCQGATSSLSTSTAMSYINTVVKTERGVVFQDPSGVLQFRNRHYGYENATSKTSQATFGYSGTPPTVYHYLSTSIVPVLDDLDLFNNITVQRQGGVAQIAADTVSQAHYGRRTLTGYTSLLHTTDDDAAGLAALLLRQYSTPAPRVRSISLNSSIDAGAGLPQMLGRGLFDRVTIVWKPLDGSTVDFSQQSLIEYISHSVDAATGQWTTTFTVTPIGTETFLLLDSPTVGLLDTNQLGY